VETSSVAEDDLSHWQAQVPPSIMTIALQTAVYPPTLRIPKKASTAPSTASNVELASCEKRSVARNLNVDPPLIVFLRDNE